MSDKKIARLRELVKALTTSHAGWDHVIKEFYMSIPARPDHDADLVIAWAADEIELLTAALTEIAECDGQTLLGCSHEDCSMFPNCVEEGMRGHERGAWRAFGVCAEIAKTALGLGDTKP